jgi:hypothetical protein
MSLAKNRFLQAGKGAENIQNKNPGSALRIWKVEQSA